MSKRILLCDDELHILRAAEFKFVRAGFGVQCASDGEEAWALIERDTPDIVVTDCQMPRLSGLELAKRMKEDPATSHVPIIMLSAKGFELSPERLLAEYGIRKLLGKPFSPRELFNVVEALLAGEEVICAPITAGIPATLPAAVSQWL
jgi:two-component system, OmpR family, alkaline phosphatase synthesis response regulator PhoP